MVSRSFCFSDLALLACLFFLSFLEVLPFFFDFFAFDFLWCFFFFLFLSELELLLLLLLMVLRSLEALQSGSLELLLPSALSSPSPACASAMARAEPLPPAPAPAMANGGPPPLALAPPRCRLPPVVADNWLARRYPLAPRVPWERILGCEGRSFCPLHGRQGFLRMRHRRPRIWQHKKPKEKQ